MAATWAAAIKVRGPLEHVSSLSFSCSSLSLTCPRMRHACAHTHHHACASRSCTDHRWRPPDVASTSTTTACGSHLRSATGGGGVLPVQPTGGGTRQNGCLGWWHREGGGAGGRDGGGGGRGVGVVAAGDGGGAGRGNGDGERDAARVKVRVRVRCTLHAAHCTLPPTCTPFRSPPPSSRPRSARRSWPPSLRRRCTQRPRRPFPFPAPLPCTCGHASMPCRACTCACYTCTRGSPRLRVHVCVRSHIRLECEY